MSDFNVRLDTEKLDEIAATLNLKLDQVLTMAAFEIEREAKVLAPVDTHALQNSIYTNTKDGGSRPGDTKGQPTEPLPQPTGQTVAVVGPCVEYGAYQEFGTSKMAAHPYLKPAAEMIFRKYSDPSQFKKVVE